MNVVSSCQKAYERTQKRETNRDYARLLAQRTHAVFAAVMIWSELFLQSEIKLQSL